ncbi:MAG: UvrB/UvrC motif-containing protein [Phycisphaerales bacterium]
MLTAAQVQRRIANLKSKLEQAVALEQYEKAVQFRDELFKLQKLVTKDQEGEPKHQPPAADMDEGQP